MGRSRQIKMDRGDTLGGTAPLIMMNKRLGKPFITGENRRGRRRRDKGGGKLFWQLLLVFLVLIAVAAVLGLGYERFVELFQLGSDASGDGGLSPAPAEPGPAAPAAG